MAQHQTSDKPLPESIVIQNYDTTKLQWVNGTVAVCVYQIMVFCGYDWRPIMTH